MPDDSDPPRKYYGLKPREFERVNSGGAPGPQFHPPEPQLPAAAPRRIELNEMYRDSATPGPVLKPGKRTGSDPQVVAILKDNQRREQAAGLYDVAYQPPRKSRRTRDFIVIVVGTVIFFGGLAVFAAIARNPVLFVSSVAGLGLMIGGSWWIMYHVMEKY